MPSAKKSRSSRKAAKAPKKASRKMPKAAPRKAPKPPARRAPARGGAARKGTRPAKGAKRAAAPRTVCIATDPFGDPCQNTPRLGSKYCGVHSHLG